MAQELDSSPAEFWVQIDVHRGRKIKVLRHTLTSGMQSYGNLCDTVAIFSLNSQK